MVDEPEVLIGGVANAGAVVRIGDEVRRPAGRYTASVQALLAHLRRRGFDGCPEPRGIDDEGRERLGFIAGDVAFPPYPAWAQTDAALGSVAVLLARLHAAAVGFDGDGMDWSPEFGDPDGGPIVAHNDVCLENVVFRDGEAVALLDFEFAAPARPLFDLAQLARMCCPLDDDESAAAIGWDRGDRVGRLRLVADAYGLDRRGRQELLEVLPVSLRRGEDLVRNRIAAGDENFAAALARFGGPARDERRRRWFADHRAEMAARLG